MGGRRAFLRSAFGGAISTAFLACAKKRATPPPLVWTEDVDRAYADAERRGRLVFVSCEASWDTGSKALEHRTYPDPQVAALLGDWFECVRLDFSDDENPRTMEMQRRFDVKGIPTLVAYEPKGGRELWRACEYRQPAALASELREIIVRHDAMNDVETALRLGASWKRPVVLFFGPSWDAGSQAMRREALAASSVAQRLRESFVFSDVHKDEGWNAEWARFRVRALPAIVVLDAKRRAVLARMDGKRAAHEVEWLLDAALARHRA